MNTKTILSNIAVLALLGATAQADIYDFHGEDYEEPAGASFGVDFNPQDQVYGAEFGGGMWLKNTPVFGNYFVTLFNNGIEDAFYSGLGMTLRLMPHWSVAPFIGGGGSYNYSWSSRPTDDPQPQNTELADRGASYWAYHTEAGVRLGLFSRIRLLEVSGRYTWSSLSGDRDYWLIGISTGVGY